jgi:hypothetical protein
MPQISEAAGPRPLAAAIAFPRISNGAHGSRATLGQRSQKYLFSKKVFLRTLPQSGPISDAAKGV